MCCGPPSGYGRRLALGQQQWRPRVNEPGYRYVVTYADGSTQEWVGGGSARIAANRAAARRGGFVERLPVEKKESAK